MSSSLIITILLFLLGLVLIVKGGDWSEENVVGRQSVRKWGGKVVIIPETKGASTTNIVEKIIKTYGRP